MQQASVVHRLRHPRYHIADLFKEVLGVFDLLDLDAVYAVFDDHVTGDYHVKVWV